MTHMDLQKLHRLTKVTKAYNGLQPGPPDVRPPRFGSTGTGVDSDDDSQPIHLTGEGRSVFEAAELVVRCNRPAPDISRIEPVFSYVHSGTADVAGRARSRTRTSEPDVDDGSDCAPSALTRSRAPRRRTSAPGPTAPGRSRPPRCRRPPRPLRRAVRSSRGSAGPPRRVP